MSWGASVKSYLTWWVERASCPLLLPAPYSLLPTPCSLLFILQQNDGRFSLQFNLRATSTAATG
ncbi:hypothetical protein [Moorena sp. SIO4G3]|uniref:hypothetical protein n=1 Tax=Moorena sp. SIO4G3 TaxID=2607821 RepID=UPI00142A47A5|nr:hypothetical protein [Moorena sp. SIO4G3]NEO80771.1 hypothetical protein [Moorena sp. SIO4G3]